VGASTSHKNLWAFGPFAGIVLLHPYFLFIPTEQRNVRRLAIELSLSVQSDETDVIEPVAGSGLVFWMQYNPLDPEIFWERSAALFARQQVPLAVRVLLRVELSQSYHQPAGRHGNIYAII
jgi:hypothetical protein